MAGDLELEALRARLEETERAMQRIVGQLAKRDAVLGSWWRASWSQNCTKQTTIDHLGDKQRRSVEFLSP